MSEDSRNRRRSTRGGRSYASGNDGGYRASRNSNRDLYTSYDSYDSYSDDGGADAYPSRSSYSRNAYGGSTDAADYSRYDESNYTHGRASSGRRGSRRGSNRSAQTGDRSGSARYSRDSYGMKGEYGRRRRRGKRLRIALVAILAVVLIGAGTAFALVNRSLSGGLDSSLDDALVETNLTKEPFYMLLLGTDASLAREDDETYAETFRTDTIILARIDPVEKKVTLVSIPRDTMVDLGDEYGIQKLNAAYAYGGATMAVEAVSDLAGVDISHFCLVDMDGLVSIVDVLGGIEVDVPIEIDDDEAGGHLDAGLQTLDGDQALILCRSRKSYDDAGDLYRTANQRLVLQAIASKLLESDIATIATSMTSLVEYVSTDLSVTDIIGLAQAFQGIDTEEDIYTAACPTTSQYIYELWYEVVDEEEWATMMERVDAGLSPTESTEYDEETGTLLSNAGSTSGATTSATVSVRNGTSTEGLAASVAETLEGLGYDVADYDNADSEDYSQTLVIYMDDTYSSAAEAIAESLGGNAEAMANDGSYLSDYDILVVVGADLA